MRKCTYVLAALLVAGVQAGVNAAPEKGGRGLRGPHNEAERGRHAKLPEEQRAKMLERFDADGDGELSEAERNAAREAHRELRHGIKSGFHEGGPAVALMLFFLLSSLPRA